MVARSYAGYCAVTGGEARGCTGKPNGIFDGVFSRVELCLQSCTLCTACHFISYSKQMNDCSWYQSCNLDRLGSTNSHVHRTFPVRQANGSLLPQVAAWLTHGAASKAKSSWVREARRVWFHEESPAHLLLHSRHPNFEKVPEHWPPPWQPLSQLREWINDIADGQWAAGASTSRSWGSCAVVGSSAVLLTATHGARIDAHDTVIRMNEAPIEGFERHAGSRTTHRVWGCQHLPDFGRRWTLASENIVIYCPVDWVGACWKLIPTSPRPRISPYAAWASEPPPVAASLPRGPRSYASNVTIHSAP